MAGDGVDIDIYGDIADFNKEPDVNHGGVDLYDDVLTTPSRGDPTQPSVVKDPSGQPSAITEAKLASGKRIAMYVGNLTWWTTDQDLTDAMGSIGVHDVVEIKFYENRANGQSKGFAVVTVASDSSYRLCLDRLGQKELHGQQPVVTQCSRQALNQFEAQSRKPGEEANGPPPTNGAPSNATPPNRPHNPHRPDFPPRQEPPRPEMHQMIRQERPPPMQGPPRPGFPPRPGPPQGPPGNPYRPPHMGPVPQRPGFGPPGAPPPGHPGGPPMHPGAPVRPGMAPPGMPGMPPHMGQRLPPPGPMRPMMDPRAGPPRPEFGPYGAPPQNIGPPQIGGPPRPGFPIGPPPPRSVAPAGVSGPPLHIPSQPQPVQAPMQQPAPHVNPNFFPQHQAPPTGPPPPQQDYRPPATFGNEREREREREREPAIPEAEFEEILQRNKTVSSSAISRAVQDASAGEYASAIETLVTAISLIKQSKIASDDRCKILITSLQDTLHGIESKSYGSKSSRESRDRRSRSWSRERERDRRDDKRSSRHRSRSRDRDRDKERSRDDHSRSRDRYYDDRRPPPDDRDRMDRDRRHDSRSDPRGDPRGDPRDDRYAPRMDDRRPDPRDYPPQSGRRH